MYGLQCAVNDQIHLILDLFICCSSSSDPGVQPSLRPQYAYIVILSVFFSFVAATTLRFKVLCIPYMCVLAAAGVCDRVVWSSVLHCIRIRGKLVIIIHCVAPVV